MFFCVDFTLLKSGSAVSLRLENKSYPMDVQAPLIDSRFLFTLKLLLKKKKNHTVNLNIKVSQGLALVSSIVIFLINY